MIPANELRIGSIVSFDLHEKQIADFEEMEYASRNGKPMPTTEELLKRFGCACDPDNNEEDFEFTYRHNQFSITKNRAGYWTYWPEEIWGMCIDLGIDPPVHRIQNIYFALTQHELTISENIPA